MCLVIRSVVLAILLSFIYLTITGSSYAQGLDSQELNAKEDVYVPIGVGTVGEIDVYCTTLLAVRRLAAAITQGLEEGYRYVMAHDPECFDRSMHFMGPVMVEVTKYLFVVERIDGLRYSFWQVRNAYNYDGFIWQRVWDDVGGHKGGVVGPRA